MRAEQARLILASRGLPAVLMVRNNGKTKMNCLHCGGEAIIEDKDEVEQRLRYHVRSVCPVTSPYYEPQTQDEGQ